ncbi:MAG: hypothetical protein FJX77_07940 [Armatimonadetes bacterium]|nr:hypothetical protein [Armatimonadota bacterium]
MEWGDPLHAGQVDYSRQQPVGRPASPLLSQSARHPSQILKQPVNDFPVHPGLKLQYTDSQPAPSVRVAHLGDGIADPIWLPGVRDGAGIQPAHEEEGPGSHGGDPGEDSYGVRVGGETTGFVVPLLGPLGPGL